ncbi:MAG: primosomal protein N' [Defluviitaleaceae bacterium]|nr:primosomal protein N' [Defluviitaleaceae bacterium]MCL2275930.1 primosomal protein N' [Defluviitaleaceae bacterium]
MSRYALVCIDSTHAELDRLFHYKIPAELAHATSAGMRVVVPFGKGNKPTTGYVIEVTDDLGDADFSKLKEISALPDDFCVLTRETLQLAQWMRDKYYTTLIACIRCITPTAKAGKPFPGTRAKHKKREAKPASVTLTDAQQTAVNAITHAAKNAAHAAFLLHGVTGSGKTEVYMHAISHALAMGKQAIVLVPEIALTPQTVDLFTARFGDAVAVTHSRLTAGERFAIWKQAHSGEIKLVIGPRSAVFAPFENLGLIIIDEEHEHTYHSETTPKYDTREVALKRAELSDAVVVLGSATPSVESYLYAEPKSARSVDFSGGLRGDFAPLYGGLGATPPKLFHLLTLPNRINETLPEVNIIDMRRELARGNASLFSAAFAEALQETLNAERQAILFLNRRGFSTFVSCRQCGDVLSCERCRVNYTYHASTGSLLCHYCGLGLKLPEKCPACVSAHLRRFGIGTQQVESEVMRLFPSTSTIRMDLDTTKGKHSHAEMLSAFRRGAAQVLIGTQMIAKGLDFPQVTLVGVIAADLSLFSGDFRAGEHTFQLLTQVAGRAGRANHAGRVFLQTYNPEHYALRFARGGRYEDFFAHEIELRRSMAYPPFTSIFCVMLTGPSEKEVIAALHKLNAIMAYVNKKGRFTLMGVSPAFISKVKNAFRWKLIVKCEEEEPLKQFVLYCIKKLRENDPLKHMTVHLSLNPVVME